MSSPKITTMFGFCCAKAGPTRASVTTIIHPAMRLIHPRTLMRAPPDAVCRGRVAPGLDGIISRSRGWAPGSVACVVFCLVDPFDVSRPPALVDGSLGGRVEPENGEVSLAGHRGQPVALLTLGRFRTEVDVRAAVGVLSRLVTRAERTIRLAVGQARGVLGLVDRHRPEVGGRNAGGKLQPIARLTGVVFERAFVGVRRHVSRTPRRS